jgi:hypothetical protein
MKYCINCDHPDLCHDTQLKICYRTELHRCQCIHYTEAPNVAQVPTESDVTAVPPPGININDLMDFISRLKQEKLTD